MIRHDYDSSLVCSFVLAVCVSTAGLSAVLADDVSGERDNPRATSAAVTSTRHVSDASLLLSHAVDEANAAVDEPNTPAACPHTNTITATQSGNWNDKNTWGGVNYPNNLGGTDSVADRCAIIGTGINVFVDSNVQVDGLTLLKDEDFATIVRVTTGGDLEIKSGGGITSRGTILVAEDRLIDVPDGKVAIAEYGKYIAHDSAVHNAEARMTPHDVWMGWTWVSGGLHPLQQMALSHRMTVEVDGDFVMNGLGFNECETCVCTPSAGWNAARTRGGKTPPILRGLTQARTALENLRQPIHEIGPNPEMIVDGAFRMVCAADVRMTCQDMAISVLGDFDNRSRYPSYFNWQAGRLYLEGTTPQTFEVGGIDVGETPDGFTVSGSPSHDLGPHTNFSMGTIWISSVSEVTFENSHENTVGTDPCEEALYVDHLWLDRGGVINIKNVRVYAGLFWGDKDDVHVIQDDCSGLPAGLYRIGRQHIPGRCRPTIPTVSEWGLIAMATLLVAAGVYVVLRRRPAQA